MFLSGTGLICSVGLNAEAACAAMRAGIAKFDDWPYSFMEGEPIVGAAVPGLDVRLRRQPRLTALLTAALADCLRTNPDLQTDRIPLIVALAEPGRPGGGASMANSIVGMVQDVLKRRFHPELSQGIAKGHTAGFEGLRVARELLKRSDVVACLIAGVDSYFSPVSLQWLDQSDRLKRPDNSNGAIPGEAAAVVLVRQQTGPLPGSAVRVTGLGFAVEKVHVLSEEPFLGLGLAEAARQALGEAQVPLHEIHFRLSDVTGETYGFKEQTLVLSRVMRGRRAEFPLWHCADSIGDTGAASGICHLVRAWHAFHKGYAPGPRAMAFASSVSGDRAVTVLEMQPALGGEPLGNSVARI